MVSTGAPLDILKSHFGYDSFRPLQEEIIGNVLAGRDSLALMPTGGGKSLCYQLPALIFPGTTLVISPLIALMKDQVDGLNANGIAARFINSSLPPAEIEQIQGQALRGRVKILYVAPERLALASFRKFLQNLELSLIAIDEAHCISEWGHEFRPDYRNLRQLRRDFPATPVIALTATATERVRDDIIGQLDLHRGQVFLSSFNRANLSYSVQPKGGSWGLLLSLLQRNRNQSTIIYCFSRRETEELAEDLNARGLTARPYHAGLDPEARRRTQEDFIRDRVPIIVATIAFGMGIDKPDIRLVVHYSLPKSLEGYYQETGRAGRDGLPSECVLFYAYADKAKQDYFINQMEDAAEQRNARQKLAQMVEFAQLPTCRRRFVLEYFGERWPVENCGGCDVCLADADAEEFDATEIAQKILSAVIRTGQRFGAAHITQVLTGSREKRILELGHDRLSVYGIVKDFGRAELRELIGQLQARGLLARNEGEFPTLAVTAGGQQFLQQRQSLSLPRPSRDDAGGDRTGAGDRANRNGSASGSASSSPAVPVEYDAAMFEELRALRKRLADARDVPAFVIFGDVSLRHMAAAFPQSPDSFARIPGVGAAKLEQYGPAFLEVICRYAEANGRPDQTAAGSGRERPERSRTGAPDDYGERERLERRRGTTYDRTRELLEQKLPLSQMARQRNLVEATIIGHLERMTAQGVALDVAHLLPPPERFDKIKAAFDTCGDDFLNPVWELLGELFTYDELRLARIYLRQEERGE